MRSWLDLLATASGRGGSRLTRVRAGGALAARQTGPGTVHLVGTAAGPLGGDEVRVRVVVEAGASLVVRSAAATLAMPGAGVDAARPGLLDVELTVLEGGSLVWAPEPVVVCGGALLHTRTTVELASGAGATVHEDVVLGRHGETPGTPRGPRWEGRTAVQGPHGPVLRTSTDSALLALASPHPVRAVVSRLLLGVAAPAPHALPAPAWHGGAVRCCPEAGGIAVTATGPSLAAALADAAPLLPAASAPPVRGRRSVAGVPAGREPYSAP